MSEIKYLSVPFRIYYWTRKQRGEYSDYMKYVPPFLQRILSPREAERLGKIVGLVIELEKQKLYTELLRTGQKTVSSILQTAYKVYQRARKELSTSLEKTINIALKEAEKSIREYISKLVKYHTSLAEYEIYKKVEKWVKTQLPQFIEDMANWVVGQIQLQAEAKITSPEFIKEMVQEGESVILPALINKIAKDAAKIYVATVNELEGMLGEKAYEIANQLVEKYKQYIKTELAKYGLKKANEIIDSAKTAIMNLLNKIKQDLENVETKLKNIESNLKHLNNQLGGQKSIEYYKQEILKYYMKDLNGNGKLDIGDVAIFIKIADNIINLAPPQYRQVLKNFVKGLVDKFTAYVLGESSGSTSPVSHKTTHTSTSSSTSSTPHRSGSTHTVSTTHGTVEAGHHTSSSGARLVPLVDVRIRSLPNEAMEHFLRHYLQSSPLFARKVYIYVPRTHTTSTGSSRSNIASTSQSSGSVSSTGRSTTSSTRGYPPLSYYEEKIKKLWKKMIKLEEEYPWGLAGYALEKYEKYLNEIKEIINSAPPQYRDKLWRYYDNLIFS